MNPAKLDCFYSIISNSRVENKFNVTAFYKFLRTPEGELTSVQQSILSLGKDVGLSGLIIVASEGINGTVCASKDGIAQFKVSLSNQLKCDDIIFKDSWAERNPFRRFKVKLRSEIVTIGDPNLFPERSRNNHITPTEWNRMMEQEDVVIIDTRNKYETELGKFKDALDPELKTFGEFPEFVANSGIPKEKKVLMYCTGGIRCEKAILEMQRQGYKNVFQLEGGILKYLEEFPNKYYNGECFVFDHRVSVDQELAPSKQYHLCVHCGNPGDLKVACVRCSEEGKICSSCSREPHLISCSKDCAYHLNLKSNKHSSVTI